MFTAAILSSNVMLTAAFATSSEWTATRSVTSSDGMKFQSITHNGNNLILQQTMPYVRVFYGSGSIVDQPGSLNCQSPCTITTDNSIAGKTIYSVEFYVPYDTGCQPSNWNNYGCYRYKEILELWDVNAGGAGQAARFRPVLQIYGPGLSDPEIAWANYNPYWRIDTEHPGGTNNEYLREKSSSCSTVWNDIIYEEPLAPLCTSGQVWRSQDYATGWSKSVGVLPVSPNPELTVLRYHSGQDDPSTSGGDPFVWDNNEIIYVDNQILWYTASEQASATRCMPGVPCKVQSAWILNGQPPW